MIPTTVWFSVTPTILSKVCSCRLPGGLGGRASLAPGVLVAFTAGTNSQPPRGPTCVRRSGRWLPAVCDEDDPAYSVSFGNTHDGFEGVLVRVAWLAAPRCAPGG